MPLYLVLLSDTGMPACTVQLSCLLGLFIQIHMFVPLGGLQCVVLAFPGHNQLLLLAICICQKHKIEHFKGVIAFEHQEQRPQGLKL